MVASKLSTDKTELVRFFLYLSYWKRIEYFENPAASNFFIILHLPTLSPVFYVFTTSTCWISFRFFGGFFVVFFWLILFYLFVFRFSDHQRWSWYALWSYVKQWIKAKEKWSSYIYTAPSLHCSRSPRSIPNSRWSSFIYKDVDL